MKVRLDSDLRCNLQGTALIGGSPTRLLRLSSAGARLVERWAAGSPIGDSPAEARLADRLLDAGMVHPALWPVDEKSLDHTLGVVIPVLDDVDGLEASLAALRADIGDVAVVVVDDGSEDASGIREVAERFDALVLRHETTSGPAAARNTGWRALVERVGADGIVAFIDADVELSRGSLRLLAAHFAMPKVGAVAPRVRAASGGSLLDRYEFRRSPLDLGSRPARVRADSRVAYVPAAMLVVRLSALKEVTGFDESLRSGEDVDFVWRLDGAGWQVRYEPEAEVDHRNRSSVRALIRQRQLYGSAAAELAERHAGSVAPVAATAPMFAIWAALIFGPGRVKVAGLAGAGIAARKLHGTVASFSDDPLRDTLRMTAIGHTTLARWLASATTRAWLPLMGAAALFSGRARWWLTAAHVGPAAVEWVTKRPRVDPLRFVALRSIDDAAYCSGVIKGVLACRSIKALLPRIVPSTPSRTS